MDHFVVARSSPQRMSCAGEINVHQSLATARAVAGERSSRSLQACQRFNGHRLFSLNEPSGNRLMMTGRRRYARPGMVNEWLKANG